MLTHDAAVLDIWDQSQVLVHWYSFAQFLTSIHVDYQLWSVDIIVQHELQHYFYTLRAGVRYIRTLISSKKQQFSVALPTPQLLHRLFQRALQGLKRIGRSSRLHWKKILGLGGCGFFVTDIISEVVLGSFSLMLPGLGPNCQAKVFR